MTLKASSAKPIYPALCITTLSYLRIRDSIRALIARAAKTFGKSRSEFMMDTARPISRRCTA